jgi:hypothetical protein
LFGFKEKTGYLEVNGKKILITSHAPHFRAERCFKIFNMSSNSEPRFRDLEKQAGTHKLQTQELMGGVGTQTDPWTLLIIALESPAPACLMLQDSLQKNDARLCSNSR